MQSIVLGLLLVNLVVSVINFRTVLATRKASERIILDEVAFRENRLNEKLNIVLDKQSNTSEEVKKTIVQQMVIPSRGKEIVLVPVREEN